MKDFQKWLGKTWITYSKILFLENVRPSFRYVKDLDAQMKCTHRYPYLDNEIQYGDSVIELWKKRPKEAEATVVHEMLHIITDPLYTKAVARFVGKDEIEDERERLVDHLANIIVK